jgi:hypothetical protein
MEVQVIIELLFFIKPLTCLSLKAFPTPLFCVHSGGRMQTMIYLSIGHYYRMTHRSCPFRILLHGVFPFLIKKGPETSLSPYCLKKIAR